MIKCKTLKSLLLAVFVISLGLTPPLFAQSSGIFEKNIIREISFSKMGEFAVMNLKGDFKSIQATDIKINKRENPTQFIISLPKTLPDPEVFTSILSPMEFGPNDPVKSVRLTETTLPTSSGVEDVASVLTVYGKKEFEPELIPPFSTSELQILLKEKKVEVKVSEPAPMVQEEEVAMKKQQEVEEQEEMAKARAKESVEEILKQYRKPSIMQVSIFNASGYPKRAYGLSVYLGKLKKEIIEESLGMKLEIINISNAKNMDHPQSTIYFRSNYLKAALTLAKLIKGDQKVVPIYDQLEKQGVDIEIYLGRDYK